MARNGSGDFGWPAGTGPSPTGGTPIEAENWNTPTMTEIQEALTDSLSRSGLGDLSVPSKSVDGSQANPGKTFISEQSTGWYKAGTNDIIFSLGGANLIRYNAGSVFIWTGVWSEVTTTADADSAFGGFDDVDGGYFASAPTSKMWLNRAVDATGGTISMSALGVESMRWNNGVSEVENDNGDEWRPVVGATGASTDWILRKGANGNDWEPTGAITISDTGVVNITAPLTIDGDATVTGEITAGSFFSLGEMQSDSVVTGTIEATSLTTIANIETTGGQFIGDAGGLTNVPTSATQVNGIVLGTNANGAGTGYTWVKNGTGSYTVTFDEDATQLESQIIVASTNGGSIAAFPYLVLPTTTSVNTIDFETGPQGTLADANFTFIRVRF